MPARNFAWVGSSLSQEDLPGTNSLIDLFIGDEEYKLNSSDCRTLFLVISNEAKSAIPFVPGKLFQPRLKLGIKTGA